MSDCVLSFYQDPYSDKPKKIFGLDKHHNGPKVLPAVSPPLR